MHCEEILNFSEVKVALAKLGYNMTHFSPVGVETWPSYTDQCNTEDSSEHSSCHSDSDEAFLNEADFASTVAKAAEMSGLTVVGSTVSDPNADKQGVKK